MDKLIEQCIKSLITKWEKDKVTDPAEILIYALKNDDWLPEERQLCKPLIEAFNKKEVTIEEIRTVVSSNPTTKQDEIDRLEKLISEGQLDVVDKDPGYKYLKSEYLYKVFKNKKNEIKDAVYEKLESGNWHNASEWFNDFKDELDAKTKTEIEDLLFSTIKDALETLKNITENISIDKIFRSEQKIIALEKELGPVSQIQGANTLVSTFLEENIENIFSHHLRNFLDNDEFEKANKFADRHLEKNPFLKVFYDSLVEEKNQKDQTSLERWIDQRLSEGKYDLADDLFNKLPFQSDFEEKYQKLYEESRFKRIENHFKDLDLQKARKEFDDSRFKLDQKRFDSLLEPYKRKIEQKTEILNAIKNHDFKKAYSLNQAYSFMTEQQFSVDHLRKPLESFLNEYTTKNLAVDSDQAIAISADSKSTLITARAGSGKTRVLLQRVAMLKHSYDFTPKNILVLVFNKAVRLDIRNRLVNLYGWRKEEARQSIHTFHSFANSLLPRQEDTQELLSNDRQIKKVIHKLFEKRLEENLKFERFFRKFMLSSKSFVESKFDESSFDSKSDYHAFLRSQKFLTLDRQTVKSKGEKYIADFLFEHGIRYDYEAMVRVLGGSGASGGFVYKPDFRLWNTNPDGMKIYIEHWGINENNPQTPAHWSKSAEDYIEEMELKRAFWQDKEDSILVESSIVDMTRGRRDFEDIFKQRLMEAGISPKKLSEEEIQEKLRAIWRRPLIDRLYTFIQKMQSSSLNRLKVVEKIQSTRWNGVLSDTQKLLYFMALKIFDDYKDYKIEKKKLDFSDMLDQAPDIIMNASISSKTGPKIEELKSVLIDEFQDFTHQFSAIVDAIRNQNCEVDIFCVGDDWQAINSFMGADLDHFRNFDQANKKSITHNLSKNYRSSSSIVDCGNKIMQGGGPGGQSTKIGGNVNAIQIDDNVWFDLKGIDERYDVFRSKPGDENPKRVFDSGFIRARYLKEIYKILKSPFMSNKEHDILILTRNNGFKGVEIVEFQSQVIRLLKEDMNNNDSFWESKRSIEQSIKFSTVHSIKGGEAKTVIILGANGGYFPLLHPDNELFRIFDNNPDDYIKKSLEEEKRLFYVAATRAKEELYFIYEKNERSPFLRNEHLSQFLVDEPPF